MSDQLWIYTYKEGLLSRVAHDLRLRATRLSLRLQGEELELRVEASSLMVEGVMAEGQLRPSELSARDRAEVERTAREAVLQAGRYPQICYRGRWVGSGLSGELELRGRRASLQVPAEERDGRLIGEVELRPSLWGIEPYTAMLGALRVQDRVRLRFDMARPG
jgi:YceI-like domain